MNADQARRDRLDLFERVKLSLARVSELSITSAPTANLKFGSLLIFLTLCELQHKFPPESPHHERIQLRSCGSVFHNFQLPSLVFYAPLYLGLLYTVPVALWAFVVGSDNRAALQGTSDTPRSAAGHSWYAGE